jgi:hypothetical protein
METRLQREEEEKRLARGTVVEQGGKVRRYQENIFLGEAARRGVVASIEFHSKRKPFSQAVV